MESVHISQFYPCSKIVLGSELLYACELSKYLSSNEMCLDLDGIVLDSALKKSRYWNYFAEFVSSGLITNVNAYSVYSDFNEKSVCNVFFYLEDANICSELVSMETYPVKQFKISMKSMVDGIWHWSMTDASGNFCMLNHSAFNNEYKGQNIVSLLALMAVKRRLDINKPSFIIGIDQSFVRNGQHSLSDIILLSNETDALKGWAHIDLSDLPVEEQLRLGYEAWWLKGFDKGLLRSDYTIADKIQRMEALNIKEGEVVGVYERDMLQANNRVKRIKNFNFAIIRKITKTEVVLQIIYTRRTRYGGRLAFENMTMMHKQMYCADMPDQNLSSKIETLSLYELGIEYVMSNELCFILPLEDSDTMELDVTNGQRKDKLSLSEVQAIYWLLGEFDVEFNRERFRTRYLGGKESLFEKYMSGKDINEAYIVK